MSVLYTKPANDKDYISVSLKEEGVRMQKSQRDICTELSGKKCRNPICLSG